MSLNEKIRKRGLTSAEIRFARDSHDHENLQLDDKLLQHQQEKLRLQNHIHLAKSRAPKGGAQSVPVVNQGDIVFTKNVGNKHLSRDPHLVVRSHSSGDVSLRKLLHTSPFAKSSINLSPQVKTTQKKFLFKPESNIKKKNVIKQSQLPLQQEPSPIYHKTSLPSKPEVTWNPISHTEEEDLMYAQQITYPTLVPNDLDTDPQEGPSEQVDLLNIPDTSYHSSSSDITVSDVISTIDTNEDHENDGQIVVTFDHDQGHGIPERLLQNRKPNRGDLISFFDERTQTWLEAKITKDLSFKYKNYFNIVYPDGIQDGLYLIPDTRWTFKISNNHDIEANRSSDDASSLKPTPETTPERVTCNVSNTSSVGILDKSITESLEWDMLGTELASSNESLSDLNYRMSNVPLNYVSNLNAHLPLTSTWKTEEETPERLKSLISKPRRLAQLRRPLPEESNNTRSFLPHFVRKMNPFKKKGS